MWSDLEVIDQNLLKLGVSEKCTEYLFCKPFGNRFLVRIKILNASVCVCIVMTFVLRLTHLKHSTRFLNYIHAHAKKTVLQFYCDSDLSYCDISH